jgi:hypothetical protein
VFAPVADGLAFSAPSMTFRRCRLGLRGFPNAATDLDRSQGSTALMTLSSPPEHSCESWGPLSATPPLMRFAPSQCALPPVDLLCVHSRRPKPPSVRRSHPSNRVPPSWFRTTMTACSTREVTGLLHPATDRGFAAFPDARGPVPSAPRGSGHRSPGPFPATRFTPSEDFPRRQPYRVTAAVALLPFHRHPYPIPAEASARHSPPPPKRWEHSTPSTLRRTLCA